MQPEFERGRPVTRMRSAAKTLDFGWQKGSFSGKNGFPDNYEFVDKKMNRAVKTSFSLAGISLGLGIMWFIYAFASIVNPELSVEEQNRLIAKKIFLELNVIPFGFGVFLTIASIIYLIRNLATTNKEVEPRGST